MTKSKTQTLAVKANRWSSPGLVSEGERKYMLQIFNLMALGVALTAAITLFISTSPALLEIARTFWLLTFVVILGYGFVARRLIARASLPLAHGAFWTEAVLWSFLVAPIVAQYLSADPILVARGFGLASATFAGASVFGYTTKRSLGGIGTFCFMAALGLLVAILVNLFLRDALFSFLISGGVVLAFSGLAAFTVQELRDAYDDKAGDEANTRIAIYGALTLYSNFVVMFVHMMNLLGHVRRWTGA